MAAGAEPLVVWINGAFGIGKTTVAAELVRCLPDAILFDPEELGVVLRAVVPAAEQTDDFQDIPAWRVTTLAAVSSLAWSRAGAVVVPMTLVDGRYFDEIVGGVRRAGVSLLHVALVAPRDVIEARLRARSGMARVTEQSSTRRHATEHWGIDRINACVAALGHTQFARHLDASTATPEELAHEIRTLIVAHAEGTA